MFSVQQAKKMSVVFYYYVQLRSLFGQLHISEHSLRTEFTSDLVGCWWSCKIKWQRRKAASRWALLPVCRLLLSLSGPPCPSHPQRSHSLPEETAGLCWPVDHREEVKQVDASWGLNIVYDGLDSKSSSRWTHTQEDSWTQYLVFDHFHTDLQALSADVTDDLVLVSEFCQLCQHVCAHVMAVLLQALFFDSLLNKNPSVNA